MFLKFWGGAIARLVVGMGGTQARNQLGTPGGRKVF